MAGEKNSGYSKAGIDDGSTEETYDRFFSHEEGKVMKTASGSI